MSARSSTIAVLAAALLATACDYYHPKGPPPGDPAHDGSSIHQQEPLQPFFSSINDRIFKGRCVSCHNPAGQGHNVLLSLEELLDSPRELVLPGNSEESGLTIAITRTDSKRMPPPEYGPPLTGEEITTIEKWIQDGAKP